MALRPGRVGLASHLVNTDGTLKGSAVTIPDATTTRKGIVKIGTGLTVSSGKVSVTDPIPTHAAADADKVLTVEADGSTSWKAAGGGGMEMTRLWTNPDLTAPFTEQSVTLSSDASTYDLIYVVFLRSANDSSAFCAYNRYRATAAYASSRINDLEFVASTGTSYYMEERYRDFTWTSPTTATIGNNYTRSTKFASTPAITISNLSTNNAYNIPLYICGIKFN